jgi:uncharacterized protein involved in type VI secretion and phage assembly
MNIIDIFDQNRQKNGIFGVVIGIVTNNQDPDGLGRVKVKLPRISGDDESNWARVVTWMAGKERGAFFLPEVDDEVLVAFEHGEISMPYVIGSLWNGVDKPPETNNDGKNDLRLFKSRSGHLIRFNDQDGAEKIEIIDKSGNNFIVVDTKENTVTITCDKDIYLAAQKGKISLTAKEIEINAAATVKVEAKSGMDLKASGNMVVKGATVNIN